MGNYLIEKNKGPCGKSLQLLNQDPGKRLSPEQANVLYCGHVSLLDTIS